MISGTPYISLLQASALFTAVSVNVFGCPLGFDANHDASA